METNPIKTIHDLPPLKLPSSSQTTDLQHLHTLMHLMHHRNHNQHRRSTWYRHFNIFRRHLSAILSHLTTLSHVPTTHLARHKKKTEDEALKLRIQQTLAFWRDVLVPKAQHAFGQLVADGRFAVLGVVLMAILGNVCRVFGLVALYEELGEEETRKAIEEFAAEGWGEDEGLGVLVPREGGKKEDLGEVLMRDDVDEDEVQARVMEKEMRKSVSGCLAPERDILEQSRKAMKGMAVSVPVSSSTPPPTTKPSKKLKVAKPASKQKTTTILPAVNWDDGSTTPAPKSTSKNISPSTSKTISPVAEIEAAAVSKPRSKRPKHTADEASSSGARPVKKKKKKNAIDDLFAGL